MNPPTLKLRRGKPNTIAILNCRMVSPQESHAQNRMLSCVKKNEASDIICTIQNKERMRINEKDILHSPQVTDIRALAQVGPLHRLRRAVPGGICG